MVLPKYKVGEMISLYVDKHVGTQDILELVEPCPTCSNYDGGCSFCDWTGYRINENGKQLLKFMKKFLLADAD